MCSRYFIRDDNGGWLDVRPRDEAEVWIRGSGRGFLRTRMRWGYPAGEARSLIFNARAESAGEKVMFRDSLSGLRCVVKAAGFYEWNRAKEKAVFTRQPEKNGEEKNRAGNAMYLAGLYQWFGEEYCFVILTTEANESMRPVHDRMPLVLGKEEAERWLADGDAYQEILACVPEELSRTMEYEQQRFVF